jgi:hypothetical protein
MTFLPIAKLASDDRGIAEAAVDCGALRALVATLEQQLSTDLKEQNDESILERADYVSTDQSEEDLEESLQELQLREVILTFHIFN